MEKHGLTAKPWCEKAGVSPNALYNFFAGRASSLNQETIEKLAKAAGCPASELFAEDLPFSSVMVLGAVQAGEWVEAVEWPEDDWYPIQVPADERFPGVKRYALEVRGPSMNLDYPDGTIIVCVKFIDIDEQPLHADHVVVQQRREDGLTEATVKEYVVDGDGAPWLVPKSSDPNYQSPIRLPAVAEDDENEDLRIVALVVGNYTPRRRGG